MDILHLAFHLQAREDEQQWQTVFTPNVWEVMERSSVQKKEQNELAMTLQTSHRRQRLGHLKSSALDALVKACEVFECWSMRSLRWACLCSYALL